MFDSTNTSARRWRNAKTYRLQQHDVCAAEIRFTGYNVHCFSVNLWMSAEMSPVRLMFYAKHLYSWFLRHRGDEIRSNKKTLNKTTAWRWSYFIQHPPQFWQSTISQCIPMRFRAAIARFYIHILATSVISQFSWASCNLLRIAMIHH